MDIVLKEDIGENDFATRMNEVLPRGIRIAAVSCAGENIPKIGKMIDSAEYEITISYKRIDELIKKVEDFFEQEHIVIEKHSKKGISQVDVKEWIFEYEIKEMSENVVLIKTIQSLSEQMSVRIDDLWNAMSRYISLEDIELKSIIKKNTLFKFDGKFITPVEYTALLNEGECW